MIHYYGIAHLPGIIFVFFMLAKSFWPLGANLQRESDGIAVAAFTVTDSSTKIDKNKIIQRIKQVNLTSSPSPGTLKSYRTSSCIYQKIIALPSNDQSSCIKATLGVFAPSAAYLTMEVGKLQIIQLMNGSSGWRLDIPTPGASNINPPQPKVAKLHESQLVALREHSEHSLLSLYELLNSRSQEDHKKLELIVDASLMVLRWRDGASESDFIFDRRSLSCGQHKRKTKNGIAIQMYSDYKLIDGIRLPHKIEVRSETGQIFGSQVVEKWELNVSWPENFFTPEGMLKGN